MTASHELSDFELDLVSGGFTLTGTAATGVSVAGGPGAQTQANGTQSQAQGNGVAGFATLTNFALTL